MASVLPALLPTVFTVSVGISDDRLAKQRIATANSESILIAGKVTRAFFDKTGTCLPGTLDGTVLRISILTLSLTLFFVSLYRYIDTTGTGFHWKPLP